ncbi:hypothetical protein QBC43DRAFT_361457 [Cladorrhinum sp. PSN259]|nr:hypothetical protein QBC43DRAFT_361457 [Cladorrhinum sp. PSN259]
MADIAGLVLGLVGVLKPLTEASLFICDLYRDQFRINSGAMQTPSGSVRISVSTRQIDIFESILLANKRFNWLPGSLFQELEPALQQDVYEVLQELKRRLFLFVEIGQAYGVGSQQNSLAQGSPGLSAQAADRNDRVLSLQRNTSWARKALWSTKDKKTLEGLANEIEHWTALLRLTMQDILSRSPEFQSTDRLNTLGRPEEQAEELRLALAIRRILVSKPSDLSHPAPELSPRDIQILPAVDNVTPAIMKTPSGEAKVLVESKLSGSRTPAEDERRRARARQLATLLQQTGDPTLRALRALGYIYDPQESRVTVVYEIPHHLLPWPLTLRQLFSLKLLEPRPALEHRFRLASVVTETLFFFHSLGWVHKSFMSENILLFPRKSLCTKPWQEAGICSITQVLQNSEIRLVGFDLARPEAEVSSLRALGDSIENLWRPPTRWGVPTESWSAVHDLYSLGAVLLEAGLWQRLDALEQRINLADPWAVQKLLLSHATQRLPYTMGSKYASIVIGLLKGKFDDSARQEYSSLHTAGGPDHACNRLWILRELNKISACV